MLASNFLEPSLTVNKPDKEWVADITYKDVAVVCI